MAETILETERLILRLWRPDDLDAWLTHLNTPQVTEHLGGVRTPEQVAEKLEKTVRAWDEEGFAFLAVTLRDSGLFLGNCGLARIEGDAVPDALHGAVHIGWQIRADHWGRGYATEAARAILAMAFDRCGLERVYAQTAERNAASWKVMEKIGMQRRADLDYVDPHFPPQDNPTIIYALERAGWRAA